MCRSSIKCNQTGQHHMDTFALCSWLCVVVFTYFLTTLSLICSGTILKLCDVSGWFDVLHAVLKVRKTWPSQSQPAHQTVWQLECQLSGSVPSIKAQFRLIKQGLLMELDDSCFHGVFLLANNLQNLQLCGSAVLISKPDRSSRHRGKK